jgi:hypothetical protein
LADLDLCGCHLRIWAPVPLQWVEWRVDLRLVVTIMDTRRRLVISVITRKSNATLHTHVASLSPFSICNANRQTDVQYGTSVVRTTRSPSRDQSQ